ncbi:MAG: hypothetical protein LLG44_07140 [Chloroflexi bacterium]|nr:hypothetical protein [Chloroflexota bacterium]
MTLTAEGSAHRKLPSWQELAARMPNRHPQTTDEELDAFETTLQRTLRPVNAPVDFRQGLRRNLAVAAQRQYTGMQVEAHRSYRQGILIGTSIGLAGLVVGILLYLFFKPHKS